MLTCARISLSIVNIVILFYAVNQISDAKYLNQHPLERSCYPENTLLWTGVLFLVTTIIGIIGYCCGVRALQYIYMWILIIWTISTVVIYLFLQATMPKLTAGDLYRLSAHKDKVWLSLYKPALQRALVNDKDWHRVMDCYKEFNICHLIMNTSDEYVFPYVDVGCCSPPNRCGFSSMTISNSTSPLAPPEMDAECKMWLWKGKECFECDTCKAAYLANYQDGWELSVLSRVARVLLLIGMSILAFFAFSDDDGNHRAINENHIPAKRLRV